MLKLLSASTLSPTKGPGFSAECRAGFRAECQAKCRAGNHARNQAGNQAGSQAGKDARALLLENLRCEMRQVDTPVLPNVTTRGFHVLIWVALFVKVVAVGLVEIVEEVC